MAAAKPKKFTYSFKADEDPDVVQVQVMFVLAGPRDYFKSWIEDTKYQIPDFDLRLVSIEAAEK